MANESPDLSYRLPAAAYEEGDYQPVVPAEANLPEFTVRAVVLGIVVGVGKGTSIGLGPRCPSCC